ncbi:MAG: glycerol-3-phosphate acyltransferase [Chloroflexi bacterium]|nr:glycerol-3-phosphate acyltransferase [Chloroflexota bacterium]
MIASATLAAVMAYLLGSIPTAYLVARCFKGVDIREVGDRNMGAKNVFREIGRTAGVMTVAVDVGKGSAAVLLAQALALPLAALVPVGLAAVSGHIWPLYLRFRGGSGFATTLGILIVLLPREAAILAIPFAVLSSTVGRRIGMGLSAALLLVPLILISLWLGEPVELVLLPVALAALVAARVYHKEAAQFIARPRALR